MTRQQQNFRLPKVTADQLDALAKALGCSKANVITIAVDRLYQKEIENATNRNP